MDKGAMNTFLVDPGEACDLVLVMEVRSGIENTLAQLPLSVIVDAEPLATIMVKGNEQGWQTIKIALPAAAEKAFYLRIFAAQAGLSIRHAQICTAQSAGQASDAE